MTYAVFVEGFQGNPLSEASDEIQLAAVQAINKAAERGRTLAAREIGKEVGFPPQYLSPAGGRLTVSRKARRANLEAAIRARGRPTSLARFVTGSPRIGKAGVSVQVSPGKSISLKKAFVIKLKAGTADIDTKFNLGLAVRLKPGERLRNKTQVEIIRKGLYLLYGPSVNQVFLNSAGKGVAVDISDEILLNMENEFNRLVDRL